MHRPESRFHRPGRRALPRRVAAALACAVALAQAVPPVHAQVRLPALGESAAEDFDLGTERRLGQQIMREVRRDPDYLDDPLLLNYLQQLWQPLVAAARQRGDIGPDVDGLFAWEAFLVRDRSVNAFALPGGYVGVHLGLIAMTATRDELASVLAHELSHVTQRHIARSVSNAQRQSMVSIGAMILAILAAGRANNPDMAQAALMGGQAAALQGQLNFSRDMEREADRIGYAVLGGAGFDPAGMAQMFDKLDQGTRLNDSGAFPYLRSHPLTTERLSEARSRATFGERVPASPWLHAAMQARARVLMDASVVSLRRLQELPAPRPGAHPAERIGALLASAWASSQLRDHDRAASRLAEARALLAAQAAPDPALAQVMALADVELRLARDDVTGALAELGRLPAGTPQRPALLLEGHALLQLRDDSRTPRLKAHTEALQTWVSTHGQDAAAWSQLGRTAEALGLRLRALRAQAEARAALGDIPGAVDRLRAGRQLARTAEGGDFIEASIIEARLREFEGLRRQLAAEARGNRGDRGGPRDDGESPRL